MSRDRNGSNQWEEDLLTLRSRLERAIDGLLEGSLVTSLSQPSGNGSTRSARWHRTTRSWT
jgi:hypothetical protein